VQSNDKVIIHLKVSKTDPFRHGVSIPLFATHQNVCPVVILRQILKLRWACKAIASDPLFVDYNGKPITRHMFVQDLKVLLERIGLNSQDYNSHSFRIGAATSAASAGVGEHLIRTLGRLEFRLLYEIYPYSRLHLAASTIVALPQLINSY
jgi:hypothetical protein